MTADDLSERKGSPERIQRGGARQLVPRRRSTAKADCPGVLATVPSRVASMEHSHHRIQP